MSSTTSFGKLSAPRSSVRRRARAVTWSVPGARSKPEVDATRVQRLERRELFGHDERRVIGQHDATGSDAQRARRVREVRDQHRRRRTRHRRACRGVRRPTVACNPVAPPPPPWPSTRRRPSRAWIRSRRSRGRGPRGGSRRTRTRRRTGCSMHLRDLGDGLRRQSLFHVSTLRRHRNRDTDRTPHLAFPTLTGSRGTGMSRPLPELSRLARFLFESTLSIVLSR